MRYPWCFDFLSGTCCFTRLSSLVLKSIHRFSAEHVLAEKMSADAVVREF